jgi:hypothetical protein
MNSIWSNLYDQCKDRRYAVIFLVAFLVFLGLAIPAVILYLRAPEFNVSFTYFLPGIGVIGVAGVWRTVRWLRAPRGNPPKFSPLSRDECHKARSKLLKDQNFRKS